MFDGWSKGDAIGVAVLVAFFPKIEVDRSPNTKLLAIRSFVRAICVETSHISGKNAQVLLELLCSIIFYNHIGLHQQIFSLPRSCS